MLVHPAMATSARRFAQRWSRGVHATVIVAAKTAAASFSAPGRQVPAQERSKVAPEPTDGAAEAVVHHPGTEHDRGADELSRL